MLVRIVIAALLLSACQSLDSGGGRSSESAQNRTQDAMELRIAQLWARVDELETQVIQQKERTKLIEKGMMLGIVPEELKTEPKLPPAPIKKESSSLDLAAPAPLAEVSKSKSQDREQYRLLLQQAQDRFNKANYGQAIVLYNEIGSTFDDNLTEGSHHYWVGLCWYYLKEYKLSEESFQAFRDRYPNNPWQPHARFYLAKIDQQRGLTQKALAQFRSILEEQPDRDLGEMARSEIENMKEKL